MASTVQPIASVQFQLDPLFATMLAANDHRQRNALPSHTEGTVQQNTHLLPAVTLYNSHGILQKSNPNSLIGYA